jgi:hypothetical protein
MRFRNRETILTWTALAVLILSVSILLIVSLTINLSEKPGVFLGFFAWILAVASALLIFQYALRWNSSQDIEAQEIEKKPNPREKQQAEKSEQDQLDIQGIARKIVRRISINEEAEKWGVKLLSMLEGEIEIMAGIFYFKNEKNVFESAATFAYPHAAQPYIFKEGEGLTGQTVKNRQLAIYRTIPKEYTEVFSGLGGEKPSYLAIIPIIVNEEAIAVIELAGFRHADENLEQLFQIITRSLAEKILEGSEEKKGTQTIEQIHEKPDSKKINKELKKDFENDDSSMSSDE